MKLVKLFIWVACVALLIYTIILYTHQWFLKYPASQELSALTLNYTIEASHGYLLTLKYAGQQTMASCALISQQCWLSSNALPVHLVEPYMKSSHLIGYPNLLGESTTDLSLSRFSDFFDLEHFNKYSDSIGSSTIKTWDYFLSNAPRDIIALTITNIHDEDCIAHPRDMKYNCRDGSVGQMVIDEFTSGCPVETEMETAIAYLTKNHSFRLTREVCINCNKFILTQSFSPELFTSLVFGDLNPKGVVVIANTWKYSVVMSPNCEKSPRCSYCYLNTPYPSGISQLIRSSKQLRADSNYYVRKVLNYNNAEEVSVAVMIRVEWMAIEKRKSSSKCFSSLLEKFYSINAKANGLPFVAMDIGKFGSDSFNTTYRNRQFHHGKELFSKTMELIPAIYLNHWNFSSWESTFDVLASRRKPLSNGYVAAVQRDIASRAKCLIVMGGGHFQQLAVEQYKVLHATNRKCIHIIEGCGHRTKRRRDKY